MHFLDVLSKVGILRLGISGVGALCFVGLVGLFIVNVFKKRELREFKFLRDINTPESWDKETNRLMGRFKEVEKAENLILIGAVIYSIVGLVGVVLSHLYLPGSVLSKIVLISVGIVIAFWVLVRCAKEVAHDLVTRVSEQAIKSDAKS
jgi:hypothetical protein